MRNLFLLYIVINIFFACNNKNNIRNSSQDIELELASNNPIKAFGDFYLNKNISDYNLKPWYKTESGEDSLYLFSNYLNSNPSQKINFSQPLELKTINLSTINDSIFRMSISFKPFSQDHATEHPYSILNKYLLSEIIESYKNKYGDPDIFDSSSLEKKIWLKCREIAFKNSEN